MGNAVARIPVVYHTFTYEMHVITTEFYDAFSPLNYRITNIKNFQLVWNSATEALREKSVACWHWRSPEIGLYTNCRQLIKWSQRLFWIFPGTTSTRLPSGSLKCFDSDTSAPSRPIGLCHVSRPADDEWFRTTSSRTNSTAPYDSMNTRYLAAQKLYLQHRHRRNEQPL